MSHVKINRSASGWVVSFLAADRSWVALRPVKLVPALKSWWYLRKVVKQFNC